MADIFQAFASGLLSADPGSGGTTLSSAQFSTLATIVAPDTMRLAIDPDGAFGLPEIVVVTAHAAAATTCTVVRGQEVGSGGVAGLAHAINSVWRHAVTPANLVGLAQPGDVKWTIAATADLGWLMVDGSTVVNAQTLFPGLWAKIPAGWKSGSSMVMPDARGRTLVAAGTGAGLTARTLASTFGEEAHTLSQAETPLKSHVHSVDPAPTAVTGSTGAGTPHSHSYSDQFGGPLLADGGTTINSTPQGFFTGNESAHTHPAGTLAVDIAAFNSAAASDATATAHNVVQPSLALNLQLKT